MNSNVYASNFTSGLTNKELLLKTRSRYLEFFNPVDIAAEVKG